MLARRATGHTVVAAKEVELISTNGGEDHHCHLPAVEEVQAHELEHLESPYHVRLSCPVDVASPKIDQAAIHSYFSVLKTKILLRD